MPTSRSCAFRERRLTTGIYHAPACGPRSGQCTGGASFARHSASAVKTHILVAPDPKRVDPACVRLSVSILRQTLPANTYLARVDVKARRLFLQHGHRRPSLATTDGGLCPGLCGSNLLQQGSEIDVNAALCDLPFDGIVLVDRATRHLHRRASRRLAGKRPRVFRFETPLDHYYVLPEDHVLRDMAVAREPGDERPNELAFYGIFPVHGRARQYERHTIRVISHDAIDVCSSPSAKIFREERLNLADR
jgi:hypothetical protein